MSDIITSDLNEDLKNDWGTDPVIFNAMNKEFLFSLDAAANNNNYKVANYLTKQQDALKVDWRYNIIVYEQANYLNRLSVWINPPYGKGYIKKFMAKCIEEKSKGVTSVMLVPATLDAQWLPISEISEIRIITGGRLSFYHPVTNKKVNGNTRGSMFVIFRPTKSPCFVRLVDREDLIYCGNT